MNSINKIQIQLEKILNHCQTLSLPNEHTHIVLDRINQLHLRINIHLTSPSAITNGFHQTSKLKVR